MRLRCQVELRSRWRTFRRNRCSPERSEQRSRLRQSIPPPSRDLPMRTKPQRTHCPEHHRNRCRSRRNSRPWGQSRPHKRPRLRRHTPVFPRYKPRCRSHPGTLASFRVCTCTWGRCMAQPRSRLGWGRRRALHIRHHRPARMFPKDRHNGRGQDPRPGRTQHRDRDLRCTQRLRPQLPKEPACGS